MTLDRVAQDGLILLGCGKMGSALLAGWLKAGLPPQSVWVIEPNPTDWLIGLGTRLNEGLPTEAAVALLAVKPQMMGKALPALQALGNGSTLFVSIAAGTRIASFEAALGGCDPHRADDAEYSGDGGPGDHGAVPQRPGVGCGHGPCA